MYTKACVRPVVYFFTENNNHRNAKYISRGRGRGRVRGVHRREMVNDMHDIYVIFAWTIANKNKCWILHLNRVFATQWRNLLVWFLRLKINICSWIYINMTRHCHIISAISFNRTLQECMIFSTLLRLLHFPSNFL